MPTSKTSHCVHGIPPSPGAPGIVALSVTMTIRRRVVASSPDTCTGTLSSTTLEELGTAVTSALPTMTKSWLHLRSLHHPHPQPQLPHSHPYNHHQAHNMATRGTGSTIPCIGTLILHTLYKNDTTQQQIFCALHKFDEECNRTPSDPPQRRLQHRLLHTRARTTWSHTTKAGCIPDSHDTAMTQPCPMDVDPLMALHPQTHRPPPEHNTCSNNRLCSMVLFIACFCSWSRSAFTPASCCTARCSSPRMSRISSRSTLFSVRMSMNCSWNRRLDPSVSSSCFCSRPSSILAAETWNQGSGGPAAAAGGLRRMPRGVGAGVHWKRGR